MINRRKKERKKERLDSSVKCCVCVLFFPISLTWSLYSLIGVTALFSLFLFSSTLSLSLSLVLFELHSSYILSTSLISRTLVTRTVMSSMRNWILQLWLPLPANEALCTLEGTLSSTQPSSLTHTNACHCRPFPYDSGLKVHRLMHSHVSFPLFVPHSLSLSTEFPLCILSVFFLLMFAFAFIYVSICCPRLSSNWIHILLLF